MGIFKPLKDNEYAAEKFVPEFVKCYLYRTNLAIINASAKDAIEAYFEFPRHLNPFPSIQAELARLGLHNQVVIVVELAAKQADNNHKYLAKFILDGITIVEATVQRHWLGSGAWYAALYDMLPYESWRDQMIQASRMDLIPIIPRAKPEETIEVEICDELG